MATTTRSRPNHYEVLGLTAAASEEEIGDAFAREISPLRPRPFGGIAEVASAYEVLRDPARRRAYDVSIGLGPKPPAAAPSPEGWHFIGSIHVDPIAPLAKAEAPEPKVEPDLAAQPPPRPAEPPVPEAAKPGPLPEPGDAFSFRPALDERVARVESVEGSIDWKRPALIVGGLFAAVAALGAGLGWYASHSIDPVQAKAPPVETAPKVVALASELPPAEAPAPAPLEAERAPRPDRPMVARAKIRTAQRTPELQPAEQLADDIPDIPTEQVVAQAASAETGAATLPLSNALIARTIGRIGYACGEVASVTAAQGGKGAFTVTCTSGDSYRAAPVHGRYRFRRSGGR